MKRIVLIEDYELVRETYKEIIDSTQKYKVVGDFASCEEAFLQLEDLCPDVVFMDVNLPGMNGIEGTKKIREMMPEVAVIVVTVNEESKFVFEALCAGAIGYITKVSGKQKIIEALEQLESGGAPMSNKIARLIVESFQQKKAEDLTDRENDVLRLLSQGKTYSSISEELEITLNTVKTHIKKIYEKLHVNSKSEVIAIYQQMQQRN
ncbi:response regulator [Flavobacterium sp.]|uniref:response regulator n=1 Tax=Flavobacterium sp. TaxID=239 RepID=UPI003D13A029